MAVGGHSSKSVMLSRCYFPWPNATVLQRILSASKCQSDGLEPCKWAHRNSTSSLMYTKLKQVSTWHGCGNKQSTKAVMWLISWLVFFFCGSCYCVLHQLWLFLWHSSTWSDADFSKFYCVIHISSAHIWSLVSWSASWPVHKMPWHIHWGLKK